MARNYNNGLDYITETEDTVDTFYAGSFLRTDETPNMWEDPEWRQYWGVDDLYDDEYDYEVWDDDFAQNAPCDNTGYCSGISCPYYQECKR